MNIRTLFPTALFMTTLFLNASCAGETDALAELYGTWATDLEPLGHVGYSLLIINDDMTVATDQEFVVAGSDCTLDQEHTGTFVADEKTLTLTYRSGVVEVRDCTGENEGANHEQREMSPDELAASNAADTFNWSVSGDTLTLDDGAGLTRTYERR